MRKTKFLLTVAAAAVLLFPIAGCTDAQQAKFNAFGSPARVTCFSGGQVILDELSTGKVISEQESDGYYFESRSTGRLIETNSDCVVDHRTDTPVGWAPVLP